MQPEIAVVNREGQSDDGLSSPEELLSKRYKEKPSPKGDALSEVTACDSESKTTKARRCGNEQASKASDLAEVVNSSFADLVRTRHKPAKFDKSMDAFRKADDKLVKWTIESACQEGIDAMENVRPAPGLFLEFPEASEYFLSSWLDLQVRLSSTVSGYILRYPRGEDRDEIILFDAIIHRTVATPGRWLIRPIQSGCVAKITVAEEPWVEELARASREYDFSLQTGDAFQRILSRLRPEAAVLQMRQLLAVQVRQNMPIPQLGPALTALGTVLGAIRLTEPEITMEGSRLLAEIVEDVRLAPDIRGAAATSLGLVGGRWAASKMSGLIDRAGVLDDPTRWHNEILGTAVTAAGILAQPPWTSRRPGLSFLPFVAGPELYRRNMVRFLEVVLMDQEMPSGIRGAAATSLHRARASNSVAEVLGVIREARNKKDLVLLGPCITSLGLLMAEEGRDILEDVLDDVSLPDNFRGAAAWFLLGIGPFKSTEALVDVITDPSTTDDVAEAILPAMQYVDMEVATPRVVECFGSHLVDAEHRVFCLGLLKRFSTTDDGDNGLAEDVYRVLRDAENPHIVRRAACEGLLVLMKRGGYRARRLFEAEKTTCIALMRGQDD